MIDFDIAASRALEPMFYSAPHPRTMIPHPFQHAGVEYMLRRNHGLFGDAPGVGKTAECILLSNAIEAEWNLVVCPASLILNWEREIWMWSTEKPYVSTYPVRKSADGVALDRNYVILSYDMLRNPSILNAILDARWDHLILDEAHYLKDPKGNQRTRPICAPDCLPSVVGRITMASGTILPNQPIECYNAVRLLNWDAIDRASLSDFRDKYYDIGEGWVTKRLWNPGEGKFEYKQVWSNSVRNQPANLADLQFRLRKHLMIRRLKEEVLPQLPPKQWHPFPMLTDKTMREALNHPGWAEAQRLYEMDPDHFAQAIPVDGSISTARRLLGEAKAAAVANYIEQLLTEGVEKIVVATWHNSVIDYLADRLASHGLVAMTGSMSTVRKQQMVDQFQTNPATRIIMGQMRVLGLGWTLTAAQDVVFAEFDYVPGNNDQFLDRIHRQGQTGDYVLGHVPLVPGTLEEKIMGGAIKKDITIYKALDAT